MDKYRFGIVTIIIVYILFVFSSCNNSKNTYDLEQKRPWLDESQNNQECTHAIINSTTNHKGGHTNTCYLVSAGCNYVVDEPHKLDKILIYPELEPEFMENGCIYHCLGYAKCSICFTSYKSYYYRCKINSVECFGDCRSNTEWEEIYNEIEQNP